MGRTPQTGGGADELRGAAFYEDPGVFDRYQEHRAWSMNPNAVMEEPALLAALGNPAGLRVLDLGCGDATIGRRLLHAGAASYLGVDGSSKMAEAAAESLSGTVGKIVVCDIEDFQTGPGSVDLVLSRMALHYVSDIERVLGNCRQWLSPAGRLIFTVVHPVITSHDARASGDEPRQDWVVDDYFCRGARTQRWLVQRF